MTKTGDNPQPQLEPEHIEILKAVAQAWHGHSSSSKPTETTSEFDTHRRYFNGKASRFKVEAMSMATKKDQFSTSWDFGQSLLDSYEILAVSKRLETGLWVQDSPLPVLNEVRQSAKRRKESRNSLRSLFNRMSSRRFIEEEVTNEGDEG